jgi:hypothetical protein
MTALPIPAPLSWGVALIASRESVDVLLGTIEALRQAAFEPTLIDVVINGNPALARALSDALAAAEPAAQAPLPVRVWSIALGDKSHAWNEYVHRIWPAAQHAVFVDGYVRVAADSLRRLQHMASATPQALGVAAVPSCGPSAPALRQAMLQHGGLHGNLYALPARTMEALRARGVRLPVGLYRGDGVLGAVLSFGMDPACNPWSPKQYIAVAADATWSLAAEADGSISRLKTWIKRRMRQAQGDLENRAVSDLFARQHKPPESLPATVVELVRTWVQSRPADFARLVRFSPLRRMAWRKLSTQRFPPPQDTVPRLVWQTPRSRLPEACSALDQGRSTAVRT